MVSQSMQYEALLSDLSEMLVTLPVGQRDARIAHGLTQLVAWLKVDRGILFRPSEDQGVFSATEVPSTSVNPDSIAYSDCEITWLIEKAQNANGVIYQRIDDLPVVADQESTFAKQHGIKSYVAVVLKSGTILLGLLLFQTRQTEFVWPDNLIPRLVTIGNIFTGMLLGQYTEETLRDSHDQVVATLKAVPDLMLEVDQTGVIYNYHLPAHEPFQLPAEPLIGQKACAILSPGVIEVLDQALCGAAQQVHYRSAPYSLDMPDGQRWYELSAALKGIAEEREKHFIVFIRDITERIRAEEILRDRNRLRVALETEKELHRIKNNVIRTISHEFRVPLAVIQLAHSLLSDYYDRLTLQQRTKQLNAIRDQVNKLEQMVGEILSPASNVSSDLAFEPGDTDLELLCQLSVSEIQTTIGAHHQILFASHDCPHNARVDQRLVSRILINLLSNAIKYSPEGSTISLRAFHEGSEIVLQVADQGIGISPDDQKRLFEPFFRAGNVGSTSGFGLGLTIVRDCTIMHQGTIAVSSELNRGTTFTVRLPVERKS